MRAENPETKVPGVLGKIYLLIRRHELAKHLRDGIKIISFGTLEQATFEPDRVCLHGRLVC
jgi:hypothetical protein